ncbi:MAG TPA: hypothetical protein GX701_06995, partial [Clostridiales bacterium]|nr:hypothetical protein [Clostridiales bacterium]
MSDRCKSCSVRVPYNSNCPLCGKFVQEGDRTLRYPTPVTGRKVSAKKILRFVFLVLGFVCLFIDWFATGFQGWSAIVCIGLFLSWVVVIKPIFDRHPLGIYILYGVLLISVFLLVIDFRTGFTGWSISYVTPSAIAGGISVLMFSALIRKVRWNEIGVYIITL